MLTLRRFRERTQWIERPRGTMGTPWLEMWIGYELERGPVSGRHKWGEVCPLTPRPTARALFRTFVAASRALLHGTLAEDEFSAEGPGG